MKKIYTLANRSVVIRAGLLIIATLLFFTANSQTPTFTWADQMGGTGGDGGVDITLDNNGDIVAIGGFAGTADFDPGPGVFNLTAVASDAYVTKLNSVGNLIWAKSFSGSTGSSSPYAVRTDINNNIYVTGSFTNVVDFDPGPGVFNLTENGSGPGDIFIVKLNSSGSFIWAKRMGGPSNDYSFCIAVDAGANVYTVGQFTQTADFDPGPGTFNLVAAASAAFVSKLDMNGNFIWALHISNPSVANTISIILNPAGNLLINGWLMNTGDFDPGPGTFNMTSVGNRDAFLLKLSSAGNFIWVKQWSGPNNESPTSIALDNSGNIYSVGGFSATVDFDPGPGIANLTSFAASNDAYIQKLDSNGIFKWAKQFGGTASDAASSIITDSYYNVYSTGSFNTTADFDPGVGVFNLTSAGFSDIFISKLDSSGNFIYAGQIGSTSGDGGESIIITPTNDLYITGSFRNTCDFDLSVGIFNITSFSVNVPDVFVAKYNTCPSPSQPGTITGATTVCNGATNTYSITPVSGASSYTWVLPGGWSGTSTTISINATASATGGNVTVTANNACGSSTAQTLAVTVSIPTVTYNETQNLCCVTWPDITLTPGNPLGGVYSGTAVTGNQFSPSTAGQGTYTVTYTYTDGNGCTNTATSQITVDLCTGNTSAVGGWPAALNVFPNPFTNEITLSGLEGDAVVQMFNVLGEQVYSAFVATSDFRLPTSDFLPGVYFIRVISSSGIITRKIIKE